MSRVHEEKAMDMKAFECYAVKKKKYEIGLLSTLASYTMKSDKV